MGIGRVTRRASARKTLDAGRYTWPPNGQAGTWFRRPSGDRGSFYFTATHRDPGSDLDRDPTSCGSRAEQRVDDTHVLDRVLERIRRSCPLYRRFREAIALNRVLIA